METTQETMPVPKIKHKKKLPKWLKITIFMVLIAAVAVGGFITYQKVFKKTAQSSQQTYTVKRGDISVTISGSGAIAPTAQYEVTSLVKGEILEAPFEEGQEVNKGDLLYKIDTKDLETNIEKARNSVEKAQMTYNESLKNRDNLAAASPISGMVTQVFASAGDNLSANGKVLEVTDNNTMELTVPFIVTDARQLYAGQQASVTLESSYYTVGGTVRRVTSGSFASSEGVEVCNVEIAVSNPGGITQNDKATAVVGNIACNSAGTFEYNDVRTVVSKGSGEVVYQPYRVGDVVQAGTQVLTLSSDSVDTQIKQNEMSLRDAELSLQNSIDQLEDYNIKAPIAGKVIQKTSKAGDALDTGTTKTVMAIIADMSKIIFEISVDELDISKINVGQKVDITSDALTDKKFEGVVDYISVVGTTSNGVTSYPVKVQVLNPDGLIPGMNVNAEIVVESKENVLYVPVSAVKRGNMVTVKSASDETKESANPQQPKPMTEGENQQAGAENGQNKSSGATGRRGTNDSTGSSYGRAGTGNSQNAAASANAVPDGYKNIQVQVGINDETNIEIISGLKEGDVVLIPVTSSQTTNQQQMPGGAMPGGGGMPGSGGGMPGGSGGMPAGGGAGGNRSGGGTR